MKELTIEEKAKAYDEALERARIWKDKSGMPKDKQGILDGIFPELQVSEDEKIRKALIDYFDDANKADENPLQSYGIHTDKAIAWLEKQDEQRNKINSLKITFEDVLALECSMKTAKITEGGDKLYEILVPLYNKIHNAYLVEKQGEQKPTDVPKFRIGDTITPKGKKEYYTITDIVDGWYEFKEKHVNGGIPIYYQFGWELVEQKPSDKVEPKFHEGDWIVHHGTENVYQVVALIDNQYQLKYGDNYTVQKCDDVDRCARLWDITKDAKDGDVLAYNDGSLTIFHYRLSGLDAGLYMSHVLLIDKIELKQTCAINNVHPATKEQRDQLEKAMADAGYTFDFDKKELKKIEQKSTEWSEEDESILQGIWDEILANKHNSKEYKWKAYDKFLDWLKSIKGRVQPKQEWSKEDESIALGIEQIVNCASLLNVAPDRLNKVRDWLKSLKPQNNITDEELVQAKKDAYNDALDKIEYHSGEPTFDDGWSAAIDYIRKKYLRPQQQWKPTEAQLASLTIACDRNDRVGFELTQLLKELKKL